MSFKNGKNIWLKTGLRISEEFFSASGLCFFVLLTSPPRLKITISKAVVVKNRTSPKNYYYSAHRPARQKFGVAGRRPIQCPLSFLCLSFWNGPQFYKRTGKRTPWIFWNGPQEFRLSAAGSTTNLEWSLFQNRWGDVGRVLILKVPALSYWDIFWTGPAIPSSTTDQIVV